MKKLLSSKYYLFLKYKFKTATFNILRQNMNCQTNLIIYNSFRLYKPVSDWLELLSLDSTGLNM